MINDSYVADIGDVYAWGWNVDGQLGFPSQGVQEKYKNSRKRTLSGNLIMDSTCKDPTKTQIPETPDDEKYVDNTCKEILKLDKTFPDGTESETETDLEDKASKNLSKLEHIQERGAEVAQEPLEDIVTKPAEDVMAQSEVECVNFQVSPRLVEFAEEYLNFVSIACGSRHSACVSGK